MLFAFCVWLCLTMAKIRNCSAVEQKTNQPTSNFMFLTDKSQEHELFREPKMTGLYFVATDTISYPSELPKRNPLAYKNVQHMMETSDNSNRKLKACTFHQVLPELVFCDKQVYVIEKSKSPFQSWSATELLERLEKHNEESEEFMRTLTAVRAEKLYFTLIINQYGGIEYFHLMPRLQYLITVLDNEIISRLQYGCMGLKKDTPVFLINNEGPRELIIHSRPGPLRIEARGEEVKKIAETVRNIIVTILEIPLLRWTSDGSLQVNTGCRYNRPSILTYVHRFSSSAASKPSLLIERRIKPTWKTTDKFIFVPSDKGQQEMQYAVMNERKDENYSNIVGVNWQIIKRLRETNMELYAVHRILQLIHFVTVNRANEKFEIQMFNEDSVTDVAVNLLRDEKNRKNLDSLKEYWVPLGYMTKRGKYDGRSLVLYFSNEIRRAKAELFLQDNDSYSTNSKYVKRANQIINVIWDIPPH